MRHVQLRTFHHVALNGGFSKAAEALGLSQPAPWHRHRSAAEFGQDPRLVQVPISDCDLRMDEALICLRERAGARLIAAFFAAAGAALQ